MSAWILGGAIGASLGMLRLVRQPALAFAQGDDPSDWRAALARSLHDLRLWLAVGPVFFVVAWALVGSVGPASIELRHLARVLGLVPVVGLFGSAALALLRVGDARRRADDVLHQAVGWSLVAAGGTLAGVLLSVVVRQVLPTV